MWEKIKVLLKDVIVKIFLDLIYSLFTKKKDDVDIKQPADDDKDNAVVIRTHVLDAKHEKNVKVQNLKFRGTIDKDFLFAACDVFFASNLEIIDESSSSAAHRDAIQITPFNRDGYLAGVIQSITIKDVKIEAMKSKLQGIFVSDGYINQLYLDNIEVYTQSQHTITLSGVKTGSIRNCKTNKPILLTPLRIFGGTLDGRSIWIMQDTGFRYEHIDIDESSNVNDMRAVERKGWNVYNVDTYSTLKDIDDKSLTFEQRRTLFLSEAIVRGARISSINV